MIKKFGRALGGSVKWFFWLVALALVVNATILCALLVTPAMFFFFWKAQSTAEVFNSVAERLGDRLAKEIEKAAWSEFKDVEFEMDFGDDDD